MLCDLCAYKFSALYLYLYLSCACQRTNWYVVCWRCRRLTNKSLKNSISRIVHIAFIFYHRSMLEPVSFVRTLQAGIPHLMNLWPTKALDFQNNIIICYSHDTKMHTVHCTASLNVHTFDTPAASNRPLDEPRYNRPRRKVKARWILSCLSWISTQYSLENNSLHELNQLFLNHLVLVSVKTNQFVLLEW